MLVTPGAKPIMFYALLALVQPGDEVIYPDPGFPIYESMTRFAGATPVPLPLRDEHDFRLDVDELRDLLSERTRLIILNSPGNPTGGVLTLEDLRAIAELALERDLFVLADEIYMRILYDGAEHHSIASLPGMAERTIVLDGFSKAYAMTGWRLGYAILPPGLMPAFGRLVINSVSCVSSFSQIAAVEALRGPQDAVDAMVAEFQARRDTGGRGPERHPRFALPGAARCLLRLSRRLGHRPGRPRDGGSALARGRRVGARGDRLRARRAPITCA